MLLITIKCFQENFSFQEKLNTQSNTAITENEKISIEWKELITEENFISHNKEVAEKILLST